MLLEPYSQCMCKLRCIFQKHFLRYNHDIALFVWNLGSLQTRSQVVFRILLSLFEMMEQYMSQLNGLQVPLKYHLPFDDDGAYEDYTIELPILMHCVWWNLRRL